MPYLSCNQARIFWNPEAEMKSLFSRMGYCLTIAFGMARWPTFGLIITALYMTTVGKTE